MKVAIYPGSFDPITNGHLDVLKRSLEVFDKVIVLVAVNPDKHSRFSPDDRVAMIKEATQDLDNVEVDYSTGLTVEYAKKHNVKHLIRGLRAVTDFEYEFQLAVANEFADKDIDMIFFMSHGETNFITSSMIMELYKNGVDVSTLVPNSVLKRLK
ncbi:MAG: pantetheine-phosphate adenylyltransferase [Erysipelotrichaceae bacterium]|jgi:pantetheine-phosphate adenylyltransferase|nr:pantetheine-phosphate adenylyltransferase [Erysipelotrichaceae bacterium]